MKEITYEYFLHARLSFISNGQQIREITTKSAEWRDNLNYILNGPNFIGILNDWHCPKIISIKVKTG